MPPTDTQSTAFIGRQSACVWVIDVCVCVCSCSRHLNTMYFYMSEGDMGSFIWFYRSPTTLEREMEKKEKCGENVGVEHWEKDKTTEEKVWVCLK